MEAAGSSLDFVHVRRHYAVLWRRRFMWNHNFMFRSTEATPLKESENELFHDTDPAMDSAGLQLEKFLSVWVQGEGEGTPTAFTNLYVRTATLDFQKRVGFLQPLQGRSHQIKQMLTPGQKQFLKQWLTAEAPLAWEATDDHFKMLFNLE
jgi:hypothetical protein